jgi:HD-GYP domain-containing protein (c-di-GMP phosphodiesterase class II)
MKTSWWRSDSKGSPELDELRGRFQVLTAANERLTNSLDIVRACGGEHDLDRLLPTIIRSISKSLSVERTSLFLVDWERMRLWTKFAENLEVERVVIELKTGLVGLCILKRQLVNVPHASQDPRFNREIDKQTGFRTESVLAAPFFGRDGEVRGALQLLNKKAGVFTERDEALARQVTEVLTAMDDSALRDRQAAAALVAQIRGSTECERGTLFVIDRAKGELVSLIAEGVPDGDIRLNLNLGIAGLVAMTGKELIINDVYADPRFDKRTDEATKYRTRCILCTPIRSQSGEVLGVLEGINKISGPFTDEDMQAFRTLASVVSTAIENAILFSEQNRQFGSILRVLAASIDAKDNLTAGHSEKVTQYSVGIAYELGFRDSEVDVLSVAALLHDYGKIGTRDDILKKPGALTPEEFEHIKQHVVNTGSILRKMHLLLKYRNVPTIAESHHERLDGSGYMGGLKGHQIPFMSKIIAVADVFEALTADRHYRPAMPPDKAFAILEEGSGTKYDANIIAAFRRYWDKQGVGAKG